jgi:hypothetical protein
LPCCVRRAACVSLHLDAETNKPVLYLKAINVRVPKFQNMRWQVFALLWTEPSVHHCILLLKQAGPFSESHQRACT